MWSLSELLLSITFQILYIFLKILNLISNTISFSFIFFSFQNTD